MLLQEALRGEADDRVLFVQHLGAPHLCQGEEDRHPRHLVLRPLQDQKYKRRGEGTRESQGEKKCTVHLLSRASEAAPHKYEEEVIIKNEKKTLPIIDSGSVLLRVVCLPQYKAPVSRALSISLFHIHNLFTDLGESQKLSPELRRLLLSKYFWHTNHPKVVQSHSLLSVYQIINVSRLTSGKSHLKMRLVNIIVQIQTYMNSNVIRFWYLGRIGTVDSYWALMTMLLCSQTVFKTRQQQTFISWRPHEVSYPWKPSDQPLSWSKSACVNLAMPVHFQARYTYNSKLFLPNFNNWTTPRHLHLQKKLLCDHQFTMFDTNIILQSFLKVVLKLKWTVFQPLCGQMWYAL